MSNPDDADLQETVHARLRKLAEKQMARERGDHTLQATALVNEAWLSLRNDMAELRDQPGRFYLAAAEAMRRILIDHARRRRALKRGGDRGRETLGEPSLEGAAEPEQVLAVDEALAGLEAVNPRAAQVVRLRFFAGLGEEETARALDMSTRTARREWAFARAWLFRRLSAE